jgi:hypothetical protein
MDGFHLGAYEFLEMTKTLQTRSTKGFLGKPTFSFVRRKRGTNTLRRPASGGSAQMGVVARAGRPRRSTYFATGCVLLLAEVCRGTATYHDALVLLDAARAIDAKREKKI